MMIYLVTANLQLFSNNCYKVVGIDESLSLLSPLKYVGLDTETTGLDPYTCKLKLCQLGCSEFQIVIDCDTIDIGNYKEFLESDRIFIGWNLKFDLKFLMHHGIVLNEIYDGFTAEKLMYLGYPSGMHSMSLKSAAYNYMNILMDKSVRGKVIWSPTLTDDIVLYSANDVRYLEDIMVKQNEELEKRDLVKAFEYENHFVIICAYFEYCGVKLDVEKWKIKMDSDKGKLDEALAALNKWVEDNLSDSAFTKVDRQGNLFTGFDISPKCIVNWNSPKQVIPLMKKLGFKLDTKDKKTGNTKESVDAKIIAAQKSISEIAPYYLAYREAQKLVSTYGQNVIDRINKVTGRIHTNFNAIGTDTARISSGGKDGDTNYINFQNFPSDPLTRSCFVSEDGYTWISCDYSSQESRIMADLSGDKAMLDLFLTGCGDVHSLTAKMSYPDIIGNTPVEEIKKLYHKWRQEAKGIELKKNNSSYVNKWL